MSRTISYNDGQVTKADLVLLGQDGLQVQDPGELTTDRYGLSTVTTVWRAPADLPKTSWPAIYSPHPLYPFAQLDRRRVQIQGGHTIITGEYAGVDGATDSVYELTVGVQDEPIVSHPQFVSSIGGRPSAPLHGAIFLDPDGAVTTNDDIGQFAYFKVGSDFAGIESYLAADFVTWRQRYCTNVVVVYGDVGHISAPAGGPLVSPSNWIKISTNIERRGAAFMVCHEWRAGGRRGWNSIIYS